MANSTVWQCKWKPIIEPRRAKLRTNRQAPTNWIKFYEEAVIESEVRTAVVQLKSVLKLQFFNRKCMVDLDVVMTLLVPAKVLCNVWSYNFYDMTLSTE